MQITRAADYAVRVMVHMAGLPRGTRVQRHALVELSDAPETFLSKVLQRLVISGLLISQRGSGGGFELAVPADAVSLLRVIEVVDGPILLNACVDGARGCGRKAGCSVQPVWEKAQEAVVRVLDGISIAHLPAPPAVSLTPSHFELVK